MSLTRFSGGSETSNNSPDNPILWPHNWVQSTSCGHFLEMNNSKDGQRVRIVHGKTKNYIDMDVKKNTQIKAHQDFISKIVGAGVKNIFVLGSCYEYGLQNGELSEASALMPVTNYGKAKTLLLEYLEDLSTKQKFNFIWGRLFYIYGDAQPKDTFFGQLREAIKKKSIII